MGLAQGEAISPVTQQRPPRCLLAPLPGASCHFVFCVALKFFKDVLQVFLLINPALIELMNNFLICHYRVELEHFLSNVL